MPTSRTPVRVGVGMALHRQLAAGVFHCGAKAADGARGTPNPAKVTCGMCKRAVEAKQNRNATSLRLLTDVRARLIDAADRARRGERKRT